MPLPFVPLVAASLLLSVADTVPVLNVAPSCAAAATDKIAGRTERCLAQENAARDTLKQEWSQFPAADRAYCVPAASAGAASYVEMLTCLEMAREARRLPKDDGLMGAAPRR